MKNYTQSPYSQVPFSDMTTDKLESAYTHFVYLLSIALSKKYNVDVVSLVKTNFSKLDINLMETNILNDFIKDCESYIEYIKAVSQIKDINITERVNTSSNMIDDVLPDDIKEKEFLSKVKELQKKDGLSLGTGSFNFNEDRENEKQSVDVVEDDFELCDDDEDVFTFDDNSSNENDNTDDELVVSEDGNVYM